MRGLNGKVAVVTGGAAGIGRATVQRLVEEGCKAALLDHSMTDLERSLADLKASGAEALGVCGDAASKENCEKVVSEAVNRWGRLDILVANAGIRVYGPLLQASEEDWEKVLAVNLRGVANACVAAGKAMREA